MSFNKKLDIKTAKELAKHFFEVVAAPNYGKGVIEVLKKNKNLRVLKISKNKSSIEQRSFFAGTLIQETNNKISNIKTIYGKNSLGKEQSTFFINVLKFIKSNAIAIFDQNSLISQSGGQTSRIDAIKNCIDKLQSKHQLKDNQKVFLFSDAFFPFTDSIAYVLKSKINIDIYAPMGSRNDEKIINFAINNKTNFFCLNYRHFKH